MPGSTASKGSASIIFGPKDVPLLSLTFGQLLAKQTQHHGDRQVVVFPWQNVRLTYRDLSNRSQIIASSLLAAGLKNGDSVGIMAGNRYEYIEVVMGGGRIGCPIVVLNNTYTPQELLNAVCASDCKLIAIASSVGPRSLSEHIKILLSSKTTLKEIIILGPDAQHQPGSGLPKALTYDTFGARGKSTLNEASQAKLETRVAPDDVVNIQFTSGTTGKPKAALLTHNNIINNGQFIGELLLLTPTSIICCPPPLFHCFGLVIGFLSALTHGSAIVFPSDVFDATATLNAISHEKCTSVLGVPTMFVAELEINRVKKIPLLTVTTALAAGALVPQAVVKAMDREMGIKNVLIAYGMTETSPVTFMTATTDTLEQRLRTVGTVMPHTGAKIIDRKGKVVPRGVRGEICTSGYALQKGYYQNEAKTNEVMIRDEEGILWMHTGDEGVMDENGYCAITGRIKDIIIRGGENIFPGEIEERLLGHTSISEASVVGLPDAKYGEVVAAFLRQIPSKQRPELTEVAEWVREALGRHKAPKYVFWVGDEGVGEDFPKTGSGKHQKHILRDVGKRLLVGREGGKARL